MTSWGWSNGMEKCEGLLARTWMNMENFEVIEHNDCCDEVVIAVK